MTINDNTPRLARVYDSASEEWVPLAGVPSPHQHELGSLISVQITNPQDGDILVYSSSASAWVNQQP